MCEWVRLLRLEGCPIGKPRFVEAGGHELAVFHLSDPDRLAVTGNSCPHAGGNLAAGQVVENRVVCPWHHWEFDLDTGQCPLSSVARLRCYEVRVCDGWIEARLPAPPLRPPDLLA